MGKLHRPMVLARSSRYLSPPVLRSRCTAVLGLNRRVYIDFDGETVSGTAWNNSTGIATKTVAPYDLDGVPGSFSANEHLYMKAIWQVVADDFAPFDIDVTTERPSSWDDLIRSSPTDSRFGAFAVVTPDRWLCAFCGGVAYIDIFNRNLVPSMYYGYAWTFSTSPFDWENIGNIISHEVGHNMGLAHDGVRGGSDYYGGNGIWGPIMGNPYRPRFVQWSKGEYPSANNTEDDVAKLTNLLGQQEDTSSSVATAVQMPNGLMVTSADASLHGDSDVDYYSFDVPSGYLEAVVNVTINGRNVYPDITLLDSQQAVVSRPTANLYSDTHIVHRGPIEPGRYTIAIRSAGSGVGGFNAYGSLGRYNIALVRPSVPSTPTVTLTASGDQTMTATWTQSQADGSDIFRYTVELCDQSGTCGAAVPVFGQLRAEVTAPTKSGLYRARVVATSDFNVQSLPGYSAFAPVLSRPTPPTVHKLRYDAQSRLLTVEWIGAVGHSPVEVTDSQLVVVNTTTGEVVIRRPIAPSVRTQTIELGPTWDGVTAFVSMQAYSSYPDPWSSAGQDAVSIVLGRPEAPGAGATTLPRPTVPVAPGGSSGRSPAPPA
jgi:hypothetical protein